MDKLTIEPIAYIKTNFKNKFGIPRQSGRVKQVLGKIIFEKKYRCLDALKEIETFSHLWLIFDFSASHTDSFNPMVRPPKLGGNTRVGVFASRSPYRPNSLGLSSVKFVGIEHDEVDGDCLIVSGVDLLDGTPIIDIKPYIPSTDCHIDAIGGYADSHTNDYIDVVIEDGVVLPENIKDEVIALIKEDPRPGYQNDEKNYSMIYDKYDFHFTIKDNTATITGYDAI